MPRQKQVLSTYGRHRNRVVSVDLWSNGEDKKRKEDLFASISSDGNLTKSFDLSDVKPRRQRTPLSPQSSSSEASVGLFAGNEKQEPLQRPKRAVTQRKNVANKENSPKNPEINFSEFDNFSLVVSDATSPIVCANEVLVEKGASDVIQQTSTPQCNNSRKKLARRIASIPNIEPESSYYTPDASIEVLNCSSQFKDLNLSSITESEESDTQHSSFVVSCDMFETLDRTSLERVARQSTSLRSQSESSCRSMHEDSAIHSREYEADAEAVSDSTQNHLSLLSDIPEEMRSPEPREILQELRNSCQSMMCLSPIRHRSTGLLISPKEKVLLQCDQDDVMPFKKCLTPTMLKKCQKIGEGVYAEVFKTERRRESVALKIIPIEGNFLVNDERQKTFEEILSEIIISKELSALHDGEENCTSNFVLVKKVSVVKGAYPQQLLDEWDSYDRLKNSENDRPDIFPSDQLFIVFEFENCGQDLESFEFKSAEQTLSVVLQVTAALAVAENVLQFEHRDLHWGNVLIRSIPQKQHSFRLNGEEFFIDSHGIKVSIIDFTLSRLSKDGCSIYTDLSSDETLFQGKGDYQFDIYRLMQECNKNLWKPYEPYTNVLWIHYLVDKMLTQKSKGFNPSRTLSKIFKTVNINSAGELLHAFDVL